VGSDGPREWGCIAPLPVARIPDRLHAEHTTTVACVVATSAVCRQQIGYAVRPRAENGPPQWVARSPRAWRRTARGSGGGGHAGGLLLLEARGPLDRRMQGNVAERRAQRHHEAAEVDRRDDDAGPTGDERGRRDRHVIAGLLESLRRNAGDHVAH